MATRNANTVLAWIKLTDEAVGAIVSNDGQGLIMIDGFSQFHEKSAEGLCQVLRRPGVTAGGCPIPGLWYQKWLNLTFKE